MVHYNAQTQTQKRCWDNYILPTARGIDKKPAADHGGRLVFGHAKIQPRCTIQAGISIYALQIH